MRIKPSLISRSCLSMVGAVLAVSSFSARGAVFVSTGTNGSLGYSQQLSSHSNGTKENQSLIRANLDNSFFIWQNWFATGRTNLTFTQQDTVDTEGKGSSQSITGKVGFNVLPHSKMPFNFSYARADSSVTPVSSSAVDSGASLNDHVVSDTISVSQRYVGDKFRTRVSLSDSKYLSSKRGKYGSDSLDVNTIWRPSGHVFRVAFGLKNSKEYSGTTRKTDLVSLDHGYTGHKQITINTVFSTSKVDQASGSVADGDLYTHLMTMDQASTNVVWRSSSLKTRVTANLRYYGMEMVVIDPTKNSKMANVSANLAAVHRFTPNLDINASMVRVQDALSSGENDLARDKVGVNYRSDRIELGKFTYNWRAGTDYSQRKVGEDLINETSLSLGHVISRNWQPARRQRVMLRGYQDLSSSSSSSAGVSETRSKMSHRVSLGWTHSAEGVRRQAQFNFSDRRDLTVSNSLQTISIDLSQKNSLSSRIKLGGNLNYQTTSYKYAATASSSSTASSTSTSTISANLSYLNPFSVAGLVFNSDFRFSQSAVAQSVDLSNQQVWNNKLIYRVGKIDTSLQYMYREARKISYNMVYFNVKRVF